LSKEDTLALRNEKHIINGGYYCVPDSSKYLQNSCYVIYNKGDDKYSTGHILNGEKAGLWITCGLIESNKNLDYYIGDTLNSFLVKSDSIIISYSLKIHKGNFGNGFDRISSDYTTVSVVFKANDINYTLISDFGIILPRQTIFLGDLILSLKRINYTYLERLWTLNKWW